MASVTYKGSWPKQWQAESVNTTGRLYQTGGPTSHFAVINTTAAGGANLLISLANTGVFFTLPPGSTFDGPYDLLDGFFAKSGGPGAATFDAVVGMRV